jgi:hypothetical protein
MHDTGILTALSDALAGSPGMPPILPGPRLCPWTAIQRPHT